MKKISTFSIVCLIFLPLYFATCLLFILLKGIQLGDGSVKTWLIGSCSAFVQTVFFTKPLIVWLKWTVLSQSCKMDIRKLQTVLVKSAEAIMVRTKGMMRDADSFIQHTNPACRVARLFPHLSVARLLMSCNDHDFKPTHAAAKERNNKCGSAAEAIEVFAMMVFLLVACFPDLIQELLIDTFGSIAFSVGILGLVVFGQTVGSLAAPVALTVALVAFIVTVEYLRIKYRKKGEDAVDEPADLIHVRKPKQVKHRGGWRNYRTFFKRSSSVYVDSTSSVDFLVEREEGDDIMPFENV